MLDPFRPEDPKDIARLKAGRYKAGIAMQALVYHGPDRKQWESKPDPKLDRPSDAIVQIDTATSALLSVSATSAPDAPPGYGPPEAARSFTFTVPAAGDYQYICILHAPSGMAGQITAS